MEKGRFRATFPVIKITIFRKRSEGVDRCACMKIAIITARGGSKRIPGKNIRPFCGKPILTYSIEAARACGLFDTVMVSTDDEAIADIARQAGAQVPFLRSAAASNDYATTSDVLMEVLQEYTKRNAQAGCDGAFAGDAAEGVIVPDSTAKSPASAAGACDLPGACPYDIACCLYPTAPFVTAARLREGMELLAADETADTVLPVVAYSFPPQRGVYIEDGRVVIADPESYPKRSQDLKRMYHDCGQFYIFRTAPFLRTGRLIGANVIPLPLSELEVQDIDSETDWQLAELKYRLLHGKQE